MRLIDAEPLVHKFYELYKYATGDARKAFSKAIDVVADTETVDAVPVLRSKWRWDTEDIYICSRCERRVHVEEVIGRPVFEYCPYCGAKMDLI